MPKYKVMIGRFPYGALECSEGVDWLIGTSIQITHDPRFELFRAKLNDTPVTMTRNRMIVEAIKAGMDYLLVIDADMAPDCELGTDPQAKPFWDTSIEFLLAHRDAPCVVAAPYCGPPPIENVYVFTWAAHQGDHPNADSRIEQYTREHAAQMSGIQEAAALPTGLMLLDLRAFDRIKYPYTYYEWKDEGPRCEACGQRHPGPQMEKASTEDVTLTRDLSLAGVKQFCNWDAWAGHVKRKVVRKPRHVTADQVARRMHEAITARRVSGDRIIAVEPAAKVRAEVDEALRKHREAEKARAVAVQPPAAVPVASARDALAQQQLMADLYALNPVHV